MDKDPKMMVRSRKQPLRKVLVLKCWLALLAPVTASAAATHCPDPRAIRHTGAIYTAPVPGSGEWLGMAAQGNEGEIRQFIEATVFSDDAPPHMSGRFGKCSYKLQTGAVDMRFLPGANRAPTVHILDSAAWPLTEGPFGLRIRTCVNANPQVCAFSFDR
jgi:hypothetical protein